MALQDPDQATLEVQNFPEFSDDISDLGLAISGVLDNSHVVQADPRNK